jgi:hypothetical protein
MNMLQMIKQKQQQKARQASGARAEADVERALKLRGFRMVEKIEVPWRIDRRTGKSFALKKVSGDFRAVDPLRVRISPTVEVDLARSVLVEVKKHDGRLPWSAFRSHQIEALREHKSLGGLSIVAWVSHGELTLIDWEVIESKGYGPGSSIIWEPDEGICVSRKKSVTKEP